MGKGKYMCDACLLMKGPLALLVNFFQGKKGNKADADKVGSSGAGGSGELLAAINMLGSELENVEQCL